MPGIVNCASDGPDAMPFHAAVVAEDAKQRVAGGEVLMDHVGAVERQRLASLAQHEQPRGVVDLRIDQDHGFDAGITQRPRRLQFRVLFQLLREYRARR